MTPSSVCPASLPTGQCLRVHHGQLRAVLRPLLRGGEETSGVLCQPRHDAGGSAVEEPAPRRDHHPLPALRLGGCPQGQVQGLLWLFPFFLRVTFSLPRALPSWPASPWSRPCCTTASSGARITGKLKLVEECCISSGISVIERGLWGTQKHHSSWLCPASPMNVAMGQQWPLWSTGGTG